MKLKLSGTIFLSVFLQAALSFADNRLCIGDRGVFRMDRFSPDLPRYVDRDFRYQAVTSGFIKETDNFSLQPCPGALVLDSLKPADRQELAKNNDWLWESPQKINIHNNIMTKDLGLYHLVYFPYEAFTPSASYVKPDALQGPGGGMDRLNYEAARLWEVLANVCNGGDGQKARVKYLFGHQMCGDQSGELRQRVKQFRKAVREEIGKPGPLSPVAGLHPLLAQLLLEELARNYVWSGAMTRVKPDFPPARKEAILNISSFLAGSVRSCAQFGLWPLESRGLAVSITGATIIPGVNGTGDYDSSAERLSGLAKRLCGSYNMTSSFSDLQQTAPRDFLLITKGYEE